MRAPVGWAKALVQLSTRVKNSRAPCPRAADRNRLRKTAWARRTMVLRSVVNAVRAPLPTLRLLAAAAEPMRQDLPQHAPLDRLVGRCRLMPPEAVALHRFGGCYEPICNRREIRVRVVEAEDQAPGADPAERQPLGAQIELEH